MKHWIKYLEEEDNKQVICHDYGLIAYQLFQNEMLITDFYIAEEARSNGLALSLADEAVKTAVEADCMQVVCQIFINKANKKMFPRKVELFSKFGFVIEEANNNLIVMIKDLKGV